jgi:hypothetical protein
MIRFTAFYEVQNIDGEELAYTNKESSTGQTLVNIETGRLYDFSGFMSIENERNYVVYSDTPNERSQIPPADPRACFCEPLKAVDFRAA